MLTLPLPLITALILGFIAIRHVLAGERHDLFLVLLVACAAQSLIISLAQHYGVTALGVVQPVTATFAPVLAWLGFQSAALRLPSLGRDWVHAIGPLFTAFCVAVAPQVLDVVLPAIFAGYALAILFVLRQNDSMPRAKLASGALPGRVWSAMAAMLMLSALSDVMISIAFGLGYGGLRPMIVSVFTSVTLLVLGLLCLSPHVEADAEPEPEVEQPVREDELRLVERLDAYMAAEQPFLDPDLTLSRLARKLHVPIKQLSAAINRHKGENVSRYVNRFRVDDACERLRGGATVTEAMLASGFNTKSNFNREFLRVVGQPPSKFVESLEM